MSGFFVAIANFFSKLFGKNLDFLVDMFDRKTGLRLAGIAAVVAALGVLYGVITGLVSSIAYVMPNAVAVAGSWIIPDNFNECLTAWVAAEFSIAVYRWKKENIKATTFIS